MSDVDPIVVELRQRRRAAGLNQDTVAGKIGISPAHLSTLERGGQSPALRILRPWTDVLGAKLTLEPPIDAAVAGRRYVLGYIRDIETENASLKAQLGQDEAALRMRAAELERDLDAAAEQVRTLTRRLEAAERRVERAEAARRRAEHDVAAARSPDSAAQAEVGRARSALDALARLPVITHDDIDRARRAIAGKNPHRRERDADAEAGPA